MPARVWLILATATIARIGSGMQTQSVGAVGPSLVEAMGLAYVALGTLIGAYSLPGIAAALPGGWLIARMGDRRMVLAALALMVIGGGQMAIAPNYQILLAGRVLSGTGAAMLSVVIPKIVFDQVPPERLAGLMGGVLAGYPLGFALALLFLPLLGSWRPWASAPWSAPWPSSPRPPPSYAPPCRPRPPPVASGSRPVPPHRYC
jgi:MFS family permease